MNTKILLLSALLLSIPAFAASESSPVIITNATEAVLYQSGYVDVLAEMTTTLDGSLSVAQLPVGLPPVFSFRVMAGLNRLQNNLFFALFHFNSLYLLGRASAFDALADFFGEP